MTDLSALTSFLSTRTKVLALSSMLALGAAPTYAEPTEITGPAVTTEQAAAPDAVPEVPAVTAPQNSVEADPNDISTHDLSPLGMYQAADVVVKSVMIGLLLASIATWAIALAKGFELVRAKRRLRQEILALKKARTLLQAVPQNPSASSFSAVLVGEAQNELELSVHSQDKDAIKERVSFRLDRLVAASGRQMSQGTGVLASVGSVAPFVGLFGTVWGIMNSFIGIAKSQTTNLAVVAPGIAEALLATAIGLVAAIPAVVLYNIFARSIATYKAQVADACAEVLLLVSRDLDRPTPTERPVAVAKVG